MAVISPNQKKYYKKIDGLRCFAILLVLFEHFPPWIGRFISTGYYGVDLFFVISGFLITGILWNSKEQNFFSAYKVFLGRRTLRIFPIYYLTVITLFLLNNEIVRDHLFWFLTYTYNYAWTIYKIPISEVHPFWSLCVEEQFYLLWPFIVLSLRKHPSILLSVIIFVIVLGLSQYYFSIIPSLSIYNQAGLLTRMSSLGFGAFGAIYSLNHKWPDKIFTSKVVEYVLILVVLPLYLFFKFESRVIVLAVISLYLVIKAAYYKFYIPVIDGFLTKKWVVFISSISYGIYVYHEPLTRLFDVYLFSPVWNSIDFHFFPLLEWHPWIFKLPLYVALTILFAYLSFKYIETPILSLKDKFFKYKK